LRAPRSEIFRAVRMHHTNRVRRFIIGRQAGLSRGTVFFGSGHDRTREFWPGLLPIRKRFGNTDLEVRSAASRLLRWRSRRLTTEELRKPWPRLIFRFSIQDFVRRCQRGPRGQFSVRPLVPEGAQTQAKKSTRGTPADRCIKSHALIHVESAVDCAVKTGTFGQPNKSPLIRPLM
jgi:hypothetical protein